MILYRYSDDTSQIDKVAKMKNDDKQIETNITTDNFYYCALMDIAISAENLITTERIAVKL